LLDRANAPAEPSGDCAKEEADEAKQCGTRHRLSCRVSGVLRLLFSLVYGLPILLLVLLNLPASILDGDVLRTRYRLGRALARLCHLLLIASYGRAHRGDGGVS
jgi:hypothetical protein